MEESHGRKNQVLRELLAAQRNSLPGASVLAVPRVLLGTVRFLSFVATQEPRTGLAVTDGSVACFAKRLLCSDVLAKFFPGKLDGMLFPCNSRFTGYSLLLAIIDCKLVKVKVHCLFCHQLKHSLNTSAITVMFRGYNGNET